MTFAIRLADLSDLPTLRALWRDHVTTMKPVYPRNVLGSIDDFTRAIAAEFARVPQQGFVLLAHHGDQVLGFLLYEIQERLLGEPKRFAFVHHLYVVPEARGQGIGVALSELYLEHALAQGIDTVEAGYAPGTTWVAAQPYEPFFTRGYAPIGKVLAHFARLRARRTPSPQANGHDVPPPVDGLDDDTRAEIVKLPN
jgi:GNAT superfamily N-acetyltransferase